jgi:hypothetical protein
MMQERAKTRKNARMDFKWIQEPCRLDALWKRWNATVWQPFSIAILIRAHPRQSAF